MKRSTAAGLDGQTFDLVIVGGGITGAATARDASLRGLSVVLVERGDLAGGTSGRSGRLIHGGVRYLGNRQLRLVRQACREREAMVRLAPHLCSPRPFYYLVYAGFAESLLKLRIGLSLYDRWSGNPRDRRHEILDRATLTRHEPALNPIGLQGAGVFHDFMTDDARLTLDITKSAVEAGALVASHTAAVGLDTALGRVTGIQVEDAFDGTRATIHGRLVINATGVWADSVLALRDGASGAGPLVRPTKGVHIVFDASDMPISHPLFFRFPADRRVVWAIPSPDGTQIYVGGTDTDYTGPLDRVVADAHDLDFLLRVANHIVPGRGLDRDRVIASWAGLRPLVQAGGSRPASSVSREHRIIDDQSGLITIVGGKLTTARLMAEEVVDAAVEALGYRVNEFPSKSLERPFSGSMDAAGRAALADRANGMRLQSNVRDRLLGRYGANASRIMDNVDTDPGSGTPLGPHGVTVAEIRHAIEHEMAATFEDVLDRRLGLFHWTADGGMSLAPMVAREMTRALAWDASRADLEMGAYEDVVRANRAFGPPQAD